MPFKVGEVAPREDDFAGGRRDQLEDRASEGGLAAAGFADEAEHLAFRQRKVDAVHRAHRADLLFDQETALDGEVRFETSNLQKGISGG